jgi:glycosyltransferase involved in cell wall biosynthesis
VSRVVVIVPAFNEEANIAQVVEENDGLSSSPDVVVIDDGSSDATAAAAARAGARVLRMPFNCGIGAGVQTGLRFSLRQEYDVIVRMDGDAQHDPRDLPALLEPIRSGRADFVLGSRYLERQGFQSSPLRRLGMLWFAWLLRLVCGLHISDPTSGFWAANRRAAGLLLDQYASDYPEVDALVYLTRQGCVVEEVPVVMRARESGGSSIEGARVLYYMIKVTVALMAGRLRSRS